MRNFPCNIISVSAYNLIYSFYDLNNLSALIIPSDTELLSLLKEKDIAAFDQLFDKYYKPLVIYAKRIVQDMEDARDLVQDTFIKFWQKDNDFNSLAALRSFLYVSVRNACLDHIDRNQVRLKHSQYMVSNERIEEVTILHSIIESEILRHLFETVDTLPEQCRKVIRMTFEEGMKPAEIAKELGVTISTVNNQKMRGLKLLKGRLSDQGLAMGMLLFVPGLLDLLN